MMQYYEGEYIFCMVVSRSLILFSSRLAGGKE